MKLRKEPQKPKKESPRVADLEARVAELMQDREHLQEVNSKILDYLDMVLALGDSLPTINKLSSPDPIITATLQRVGMLVPFRVRGICIVNEQDNDFVLNLVEPAADRPLLAEEMNALIDQGVFSWALREKRPVTVPGVTGVNRVVLHALTTSSRIRGMFIGIMAPEADEVPDVSWSIFSITLQFCSNILESYELYRILRESNRRLAQQIA